MKTYLLIFSLVTAVVASNIGVNAQSGSQRAMKTTKAVKQAKVAISTEVSQSTPLPAVKNLRRGPVGGNSTLDSSDCFPPVVTLLGTAGNAFGASGGPRTNLWYDADINTVAYTHRSTCNINGAKGTGWIRYDYSTNGGATWQVDQGPTYKDMTATNCLNGTQRARYPAGGIYNPPGNTDPANAWMNSFGPITNDVNWTDNFEGTSQLGSSTNKQMLYPYTSVNSLLVDGYHIVKSTGTIWTTAQTAVPPGQLRTDYTDTLNIGKGIFNVDDVNFTFSKLYAPVSSGPDGKLYVTNAVAFNDAGDIGYIVVIGNDQVPLVDSVYYPIVYKTTDGGNNWTKMTDVNTNMFIHAMDAVLSGQGYGCTTGFDVDCAVDKDNNLHIAVNIGAYAGDFAIGSSPGLFGVFDIYTTDGGTNWYGQLMATPQTFRGTFGDGSTANPELAEDSRAQATRSWDGSKIFISWFDTDTLQFGTTDNIIPDWWVGGYDVNSQKLTPLYNMTKNTDADGFCTYGSLSYYSDPGTGGDETLPMVFAAQGDVVSTGLPVQYNYVGGACINGNKYTVDPSPILLTPVGVKENVKSSFAVSTNYPNPFNGFTTVDVTLPKTADVTIEVSNMVGQVLSTTTHRNLSGKNSLTIDGSNLAKGVYIYKVKSDEQVVSRTMTVR